MAARKPVLVFGTGAQEGNNLAHTDHVAKVRSREWQLCVACVPLVH